MEIIYIPILGILLICVIIVLIHKFLGPKEAYKPGVTELVEKLVTKAGPALDGKVFNRYQLNNTVNENVDVALYYNFKKLLNAGQLTAYNLTRSIL